MKNLQKLTMCTVIEQFNFLSLVNHTHESFVSSNTLITQFSAKQFSTFEKNPFLIFSPSETLLVREVFFAEKFDFERSQQLPPEWGVVLVDSVFIEIKIKYGKK